MRMGVDVLPQVFIAMVKRTMEAVERDVAEAEKLQVSAAPLKSVFKSFTSMVSLTSVYMHSTNSLSAPQEGP